MPSGLVTKGDHLKKVFNFIFRLRSCSKVFFVTKHLKCVLGDYQFKIKYQIRLIEVSRVNLKLNFSYISLKKSLFGFILNFEFY